MVISKKWTEYVNVFGRIPTRVHVGIMIFIACVLSYMLRTNLSINILAMVKPKAAQVTTTAATPVGDNATTPNPVTTTAVPDYGERYDWTESQSSILLGAYFWGYLISTLVGGFLAERYGAATVILVTMCVTCITTAFCPLGAHAHFAVIYILRFLTGAFAGPLYPCLQHLIARWAPPTEKGKFTSAMMGGNFGTLITWPLVGVIIESIGWIYGFYIPALLSGVAAFFWWYNVRDTPDKHPRITEAEKKYIEDSFKGTVSHKKSRFPFVEVLKSIPFWALLFLHYGSMWGMYFLLTAAPKFMNEVLGFNLTSSGVLAAVPYLTRLIMAFVFGSIGDYLLKKELLSVTAVRKIFSVVSHVIPGLLLVVICFIGYQPYWCVAIISLSLGFNGSSTITNLANAPDLAPNFAGSIYSLINFVGTTSGFISPMVVAHFTKDGNSIEHWYSVFIVGAVVYIVPAIVFIFFGSGDVQPWNDPEKMHSEAEAAETPPAEVKVASDKSVTRL